MLFVFLILAETCARANAAEAAPRVGEVINLQEYRQSRVPRGTSPSPSSVTKSSKVDPGAHHHDVLKALMQLYRVDHLENLPEYAGALALRIINDSLDPLLMRRYELAYAFGVTPIDELGPGLEPRAAHDLALDMAERRPTPAAVTYEIMTFRRLYVQRGARAFADRRRGSLRDVRRFSVKAAAIAPVEPLGREYSPAHYRETVELLTHIYRDQHLGLNAEEIRTLALELVQTFPELITIKGACLSYGRALDFARKSAAELWPVTEEQILAFARELYLRRGYLIDNELDAIKTLLDELLKGAPASHRRALDPVGALKEAQRLAALMEHASAEETRDLIQRMDQEALAKPPPVEKRWRRCVRALTGFF